MNGSVARRTRALLSIAPAASTPALVSIGLGVLLLWFSVYTIMTLHVAWMEDVDYSHGYLVVALCGWLCMLEVRRAPLAPFVPSWLGLTCFLGLALVTLAGLASTTQVLATAALPALCIATIWAAAGAKNARRFALPLAYLYVAIPVWTVLIEPLRRLTVSVVTGWIRAADLPAFIEGNLIHVPSGTFEVQGGCAGLRYAIIAVALAGFGNLLNRRHWVPSAWVLAFALALALVGNWVRVFITVAVGQSDAQNLFTLFVRDHHTFFGWVLFGVFMIPLFYVDRALQPKSSTPAAPTTAVDSAATPAWRLGGTYAVCALLGLGIWLNHRIAQGDEPAPGTLALVAPEIPGWQRVADWQDPRLPQYVGATAEIASWYADGAARVGAYVAHYPLQRQEHEAVFYQNRPEGQSGAVVAQRRADLAAGSGITIAFQELEVTDSPAERRLVWVGLRVAGKPVTGAVTAKAWQIAGAIRGRRDAQALVLTAACGDDCSSARSYLSRYATVAAEPLYRQAEQYLSATPVRAGAKDGIP